MERLSEIFRRDHARSDEVLTEIRRCAAAGDWGEALAGFALFRAEIERHMATEEELLLPAAERRGGPAGIALAQILRKGHRDLRVFFDELQEAMEASDEEEFQHTAATTSALLHRHDETEEAELYPAAEQWLDDGGAAAIARLARR